MEISEYTDAVRLEDSIYLPKDRREEISYPSDGNETCFQIEDGSFWFLHRNRCILEVVEQYHDESGVLFDVGGGNGFVAVQLQQAGYDVCLIEPGFEGVKNARSRGVKNIIHATFSEVNFKANRLASLGLFDVIEHIEDDVAFLLEIKQKLKVGARIFITVPAYNFLWSANDEIAGHYRRYTRRSLRKLCEDCGLSIVYMSYIFSWLIAPIFLMRTVPSRMGIITSQTVRAKTMKHHKTATGMGFLIKRMADGELARIRRQKPIWFGSSCLVVAQKI